MSDPSHDDVPPGRPIRLVPTRPGFWRLLLGLCLATFAPLFGFLVGTITGSGGPASEMTPQYWGLLVGFLLGGLGLVMAFLGGRRIWLDHDRRSREEVAA